MRDGFIRVAAATPKLRVADPGYNAGEITALIREAAAEGVKVLALPELCLTGYTCGDLFFQDALLEETERALGDILRATGELDLVAVLGLPVRCDNKLYNCAAVIQKGDILGLIPKTYIPGYGEFYETRWFTSGGRVRTEVPLCGALRPLDGGTVFPCETVPGLVLGVEICEDLWSVEPPSGRLAKAGATVVVNLSASDEVVGKAAYRRELVRAQSARCVCGYIYADAGEGESTSDLVFCGHDLIAENGVILAESRYRTGLTVTELDVGRLTYERRRMNTFPAAQPPLAVRPFSLEPAATPLTRPVERNPFVPSDSARRTERCEDILNIAALGLKTRLERTGFPRPVIGLSGGLDSTLAILIAARAMDLLGRPRGDILGVTMPCFGTTRRTRSNAEKLAEALGAELRTVNIGAAVTQHFADIGQSPEVHDVTFENAQARERTQVLMDLANMENGLVVGTGDLSELALGWCTYNGDQMSMYGVNASIPKTLVRHVVRYVADTAAIPSAPGCTASLSDTLYDVLDTPVSPELLPAQDGEISQKTEDLVGPYELHDFFLYYFLRWGFPPKKIFRLAQYAFWGEYTDQVILKWLKTFCRRFFAQQFKRDPSPDGPKVGSAALSPRGDWRMPADASSALWMAELAALEETVG